MALHSLTGTQSTTHLPSTGGSTFMTNRRNNTRRNLALGTAFFVCVGLPLAVQAQNVYENRGSQNYHTQYGNYDYKQNSNDYGYRGDRSSRMATSSGNPTYQKELRRSDEQVRRDILAELGEGTERVQVHVRDGVATLTGMVENREAMVEVEEDAYEGGARKVRNQLEVFRLDDRPWAEMSDRQLARAVRKELSWSPYVDSDPIRVSVRRGVVTLKGSVEDRAEMAAAVDNAYEAGARRINNKLRIAN